MKRRLLLDNRTFAFKARLLFTEATLEYGVRGENYIVFLQLLRVSDPRRAMPDKYIHAGCMSLNLIAPLHNGDCGTMKWVRLRLSDRDKSK